MSKKILILDDESEFIVSLKNFLKEFNYSVDATMFPNHALDLISKHKPDIVIFDYKLPDMDGDVFFKKAKELSSDPAYILITAYRDDKIINKFKNMGVTDVILKPIDLQNLLQTIERNLKSEK